MRQYICPDCGANLYTGKGLPSRAIAKCICDDCGEEIKEHVGCAAPIRDFVISGIKIKIDLSPIFADSKELLLCDTCFKKQGLEVLQLDED